MNQQTTKARCWKCKQIFHIVLRDSDARSYGRVKRSVPCPYCEALCNVVLREDQVPIRMVYRGENGEEIGANWFARLPTDALSGLVLESAEREKTQNQTDSSNEPGFRL